MLSPAEYTFFSPTRIEFGCGRFKDAGREIALLRLTRVLIVSDPGLRNVGILRKLEGFLRAEGVDSLAYTEIETNPDTACVERGVVLFEQFRGNGLVALGGGSPIDVAKAIGVAVTHGFPIEDFGLGKRVVERPIPPLVTIPTTAGTGSEVTRGAIISSRGMKRKMVIITPIQKAQLTSAKVCIVDPELTLTLPKDLTVATGLDALSHGLEQLVSNRAHPASRALAAEVVRLVFTYLKRAYLNAQDLEARSGMLHASVLGGLGMSVGLGAAHAIAHALGAHYNLHHGVAVAVALPPVMMANLPSCEAAYAQVFRQVSSKAISRADHNVALALIKELIALMTSVKVPQLYELAPELNTDDIVEAAEREEFLMSTNPRRLTRQELAKILSSSYADTIRKS
jgi:alcohol dehydrogenase class IV